jgi:uncharacterized membrane protein YGL010W
MKRSIQDWFDAYGESHQNKVNKAIHWLCVPVIFLCVIGLFSLIPHAFLNSHAPKAIAPYIHIGTVVIILGLLFYLRLSLGMFAGMAVVSAISLILVYIIHLKFGEWAWAAFVVLFVLAWVGQFIGHSIEGKKPSFVDDLQFLLIGPAWLLGFIYRKFNINY